eukprot:TRINITY_DN1926_c0_g5_i1.p1 TRINITY_DN1926_c0_g5~~TRINITY_DN1926_c0_g5_i1.p1  ORF type:complete len:207 (+),score=52.13 TRINITY_DN1926_c0_g5_i1:113-733(+)
MHRVEKIRKELEALVLPFQKPKVYLEQYCTSPHLAACIMGAMEERDEIVGLDICDLGCGTGMLTIASQLKGANLTVGVDVDPDALEVAQRNVAQFDDELCIEFIQSEVGYLSPNRQFDVVITNPPFGTKKEKADAIFIIKAVEIAKKAVYSIHKSSTRRYLGKLAKALKVKMEVVAEMKFDIPKTYKFHKKDSVDVDVDLLRFYKE